MLKRAVTVAAVLIAVGFLAATVTDPTASMTQLGAAAAVSCVLFGAFNFVLWRWLRRENRIRD